MRSTYLDRAARAAHLESLFEMVQRRVDDGDTAYLITFVFWQLNTPKSEAPVIRHKNIERFYRVYCDRVVDRNSQHPLNAWKRPLLIGSKDVPFLGRKATAEKLRVWRPNDGDHDHGVMCIRNVDGLRSNINLDEYVKKYQSKIARDELQRVHCVEITSRLKYVFKYAMKAHALGCASDDDLFIFK